MPMSRWELELERQLKEKGSKLAEKELLDFLKRNKGQAFTRRELIEKTGFDPILIYPEIMRVDSYRTVRKDREVYYMYHRNWAAIGIWVSFALIVLLLVLGVVFHGD